nr:hypothetical protein [Tanacetum cinerariifolium]
IPPRSINHKNNGPGHAFIDVIEQAVATLLPTLTARITDEICQNMNNGNNSNQRNDREGNPGGLGGDAQPTDIHVWLESTYREDLRGLGCEDQFKERLATYKLECDAHSWWRAYKQANGGDAYVATLPYNDFRDIFFLQYFPYSEKQKCEREYKLIHQLDGETCTDFMNRFLRLAGFLGTKAGTQEEQSKNFKWGLNVLDRIVNTKFIDVAKLLMLQET